MADRAFELLRVEDFSAGYGEAIVLSRISFALPEGGSLALLGRNGTGKTTLMNTLAGATRQHGGSITLAGIALHKLLILLLQRLHFLFEGIHAFQQALQHLRLLGGRRILPETDRTHRHQQHTRNHKPTHNSPE